MKFPVHIISPLKVALPAALLLAGGATATTVDLTSGAGSSGTIGGVLFEYDQLQPAGTGVLNPFVRIQANGDEEGYNTSNSDFPFDEQPPAGGFTRDVLFSELQSIGGVFQFVLDVAEPQGGDQNELDLIEVQIFVSDVGSQNTTDLTSLGTLLYDMDALEDSEVLMALTTGNGISDMLMSVPESVFAGVEDDQFIILYSKFDRSGGSFEEWAHVTDESVPEPGTALLLAAGLAGLGFAGSPGRMRK